MHSVTVDEFGVSTFVFDSKIEFRGEFEAQFSDDVLALEPTLLNASLRFAEKHGGEATKAFCKALPEDWREGHVTIMARPQKLDSGQISIGRKFHQDGPIFFPGNWISYDGQAENTKVIMGLVNAHVAPTRFALSKEDTPVPFKASKFEIGEIYRKVWPHQVLKGLEKGEFDEYLAESGKLIQFGCQTWHTATPVVVPGIRVFLAALRGFTHCKSPRDEICPSMPPISIIA